MTNSDNRNFKDASKQMFEYLKEANKPVCTTCEYSYLDKGMAYPYLCSEHKEINYVTGKNEARCDTYNKYGECKKYKSKEQTN